MPRIVDHIERQHLPALQNGPQAEAADEGDDIPTSIAHDSGLELTETD